MKISNTNYIQYPLIQSVSILQATEFAMNVFFVAVFTIDHLQWSLNQMKIVNLF